MSVLEKLRITGYALGLISLALYITSNLLILVWSAVAIGNNDQLCTWSTVTPLTWMKLLCAVACINFIVPFFIWLFTKGLKQFILFWIIQTAITDMIYIACAIIGCVGINECGNNFVFNFLLWNNFITITMSIVHSIGGVILLRK